MPLKTSEPFGISQSICTRTLRNLTRYLHRNPPEPDQASSPPKPPGTSQGLCTGTFRNLTRYLHRNPPEHHKVSAPEPSGTAQNPPEPQQVSSPEPSGISRGICTGTLRNLTRYLHQTLRNLVRNLVLKLHRIAPELIWARDPIYSKVLPLGEKSSMCQAANARQVSSFTVDLRIWARTQIMQGCTSERLRVQSLLVFYDRFYGLSLFIVFSHEWPNDSNHASSLGTAPCPWIYMDIHQI